MKGFEGAADDGYAFGPRDLPETWSYPGEDDDRFEGYVVDHPAATGRQVSGPYDVVNGLVDGVFAAQTARNLDYLRDMVSGYVNLQ